MKTVTLNNGVEMPILGLGVLRTTDDETKHMVTNGLKSGSRLIDTAAGYKNEEAVGEGIKASGIKREDIFLTSKLWITDTGYEKTFQAFERTLERLDTDYLDLWLIHQPYGDTYGSWRAMNELYAQGKIRAIGVSNFYNDQLMDFICNAGGIVPAVNQLETHIYNQNQDVNAFLKQQDVQLEAWSPFASGLRNVFEEEALQRLATKYNRTVDQIILRWLTQREIVVISKTVHEERMVENLNSLDFTLSEADMTVIKELDEESLVYPSHRDPEFIKYLSGQKLE